MQATILQLEREQICRLCLISDTRKAPSLLSQRTDFASMVEESSLVQHLYVDAEAACLH